MPLRGFRGKNFGRRTRPEPGPLGQQSVLPHTFLKPEEFVLGLCAQSVTTDVFGCEAIFLFRVFHLSFSPKSIITHAMALHSLIIA